MGELISQPDDNELLLGQEVRQIEETSQGLLIKTDQTEIESDFLINCAGLHSDRVARLSVNPFRPRSFLSRGSTTN